MIFIHLKNTISFLLALPIIHLARSNSGFPTTTSPFQTKEMSTSSESLTTTVTPYSTTVPGTTNSVTEALNPNSGSGNETNSTASAPSTIAPLTPTSTSKPLISKASTPFFCPCDYHVNSCDFNCCCDLDCSENSKAMFSQCIDEESFQKLSTLQNSRRCYKQNFIFRNNTVFKTEVTKSGLFCVIADNLHQEEEFPAAKINLSRLLNEATTKYFWGFDTQNDITQSPWKNNYKYGIPIQLVKSIGNKTSLLRIIMGIPSSAYNGNCNVKIPVTFLETIQSQCHLTVSSLKLECTATTNLNAEAFLKNLFVIRNPSLNLTNENLVNFTYLSCPNTSSYGCNKTDLYSPILNEMSSNCENILQELDLVFIHKGVEGIIHALAHIRYMNYSLTTKRILQKFTVRFKWENPGEDNVHPHHDHVSSGNPGYLIGKPVLIGTAIRTKDDVLLVNKTKEKEILEKLLETRKLVINPKTLGPFTVMSPQGCIGERKELRFGYDLTVNCFMDISNVTSCDRLQQKIGELLLGISPNELADRHVAVIGSPDLTASNHWVSLHISNPLDLEGSGLMSKSIVNGCEGLVTTLHIQILHARVGSIHFPQRKILGVLFQFGESRNIPKRTDGNQKNLLLTTTAKFADITPSPVTPIPKWPIISIKLPSDFFYPFSLGTGEASNLRALPFLLIWNFIGILLGGS